MVKHLKNFIFHNEALSFVLAMMFAISIVPFGFYSYLWATSSNKSEIQIEIATKNAKYFLNELELSDRNLICDSNWKPIDCVICKTDEVEIVCDFKQLGTNKCAVK